MESLILLGVSGLEHGAHELARLTLPREERPRRMAELASALGVSELLYLATCNRVEVVLRGFEPSSENGIPGGELRRRVFATLAGRPVEPEEAGRLLFCLTGEAAARHLFEVACGLDSAQLGEREIQGQLREALAQAREAGTAGGLLGALIEEALKVARQVHLTTQLGRGRVSLAEIAGELLLERVRRTPGVVALVGVSPMIRRAAETLLREGVPFVLANRTLAHAEALLAEIGATAPCLALEELRERPPRVEALLTATGASEPVLDRAALERLSAHTESQEPLLLVDMAIPCDVEPAVAEAAGVVRVGIDEVSGLARQGHEARRAEAWAARELVEEALSSLRRRLAERALAPVITRINRRFRDTALEGVERLLRRQGLALEGEARDDLERWAETLARRFAHLPTLGLKGLAAEQGMAAVESFLAACGEDLVEEVRGEDLGGAHPRPPAGVAPLREVPSSDLAPLEDLDGARPRPPLGLAPLREATPRGPRLVTGRPSGLDPGG